MSTGISGFFMRRRRLLWLLLAVNFFSSLYGFYWYRHQFAATPRYLWFFVPDCPLAAILMAAALGLYLLGGVRRSWFQFLTYTTLIKYGFWTAFVFLLYWGAGGRDFSFEYIMLFLSHLGMLAEGLVFLGSLPQLPRYWWLAAGWSAVDIYFDYYLPVRIGGRGAPGLYPYLPDDAHRPIILLMTLGITLVFVLVAAAITLRERRRLCMR